MGQIIVFLDLPAMYANAPATLSLSSIAIYFLRFLPFS
jgi:hypothetical protein